MALLISYLLGVVVSFVALASYEQRDAVTPPSTRDYWFAFALAVVWPVTLLLVVIIFAVAIINWALSILFDRVG